MKFTILTILTILTTAVLSTASGITSNANSIKRGEAELTVSIDCPDTSALANSQMWVDTSPIFSDLMANESYRMQRNGNRFTLSVHMELEEEIVGLRFECDSSGFGTMLSLQQSCPTEITFTVDENFTYEKSVSNRNDDLTPSQYAALSRVLMEFYSDTGIVPDSLYSSWKLVREYETEKMFPSMLHSAFESDTVPAWVPDWFINTLKCRFASIQVMPYVKAAERMNGLKVDEPPMESYTFLDRIDYSSIFLKRLPFAGLKPFLYGMLRFPGKGLEKIGESSVAEWKEASRRKLSRAISNPSPLLLELLAAMSFIEQIDIAGVALSEKQIENVDRGFSEGLAQIINERNNRLLKALAKRERISDLSDKSFNLLQYIDEHYPGKAVIVDFWNTWCSPCLAAMQHIKSYCQDTDLSHIVFLNISSDSSPLEEWAKIARESEGEQIRISDEDFRLTGSFYHLSALPSYLIYDRNHQLVTTRTGIPSKNEFDEWLRLIKKTE